MALTPGPATVGVSASSTSAPMNSTPIASTPMASTMEAVVPDDRTTHLRNRVSWGAILAGVAAALVVQLLLNIFGIGVGASSLDAANTGDNPTAGGFSLTAAVWWTVSGIVASLVGGITAGRLCGTSDDNTARWHGFVSWCVATMIVRSLS